MMDRTAYEIACDFLSVGLTPPDPEVIEYIQQHGRNAEPTASTAGASDVNSTE